MPREKPRYDRPPDFADRVRTKAPENLTDFSNDLRQALRAFCPERRIRGRGPRSREAQNQEREIQRSRFVEEILSEARWAVAALESVRLSLSKKQLVATCADLLARLNRGAPDRLRKLPRDLDAMMPLDADRAGLADQIDVWIQGLKAARKKIDLLPTLQRSDEARASIAKEMALRVLRAAKTFNMKISASGSAHFPGYESQAVKMLKAIGDDIGLELKILTWRNVIAHFLKRERAGQTADKAQRQKQARAKAKAACTALDHTQDPPAD